jgi:hypothetical protein
MGPTFQSEDGRWEAATEGEVDQVDVVRRLNSMVEDADMPRRYQVVARLHVPNWHRRPLWPLIARSSRSE